MLGEIVTHAEANNVIYDPKSGISDELHYTLGLATLFNFPYAMLLTLVHF